MKTSIPCVTCGKEINPTNDANNDTDIAVNMMWHQGSVAIMNCGYGSRYDLTNIVIAMCDDCVEKNLQQGRIAILNYE